MTWKFDGRPQKRKKRKKTTKAPPLYYGKLCASFQSHRRIQTGVTLRKHSIIWSQLVKFMSPVTLKYDGWPRKTIGHIFSATSSFVHHFIAIDQFKMELQSGNAKFGSKLAIFVPWDLAIWRTTLKKIGHRFYATSIVVDHFIAIREFKLELQSGNG